MQLIRTKKTHTVPVKFLIDDQEQELKLIVNCLTPRKITEWAKALQEQQGELEKFFAVNASVISGWEEVYDAETGQPIPYTPEKLVEMQLDYTGLNVAICNAINKAMGDLREKNSGGWLDSQETKARPQ